MEEALPKKRYKEGEIANNKGRVGKCLLITVKLLVTAGLLMWLFRNIEIRFLVEIFSKLNILWLLFPLGLLFIGYALACYRWWLLLCGLGIRIPYIILKPVYYVGLFFNQLLPTGIGGDAVRTYSLYRQGFDLNKLAGSAIIDRLFGFFTFVCIGIIGILLNNSLSRDYDLLLPVALFGVVVITGFSLTFWSRSYKIIQHLLSHFKRFRIVKFGIDIHELCHSYSRSPQLLLSVFVISVFISVIDIFVFISLGYMLQLKVPIMAYLAIIPVALLATSIPISLGGLGVREGVLVLLLLSAGADKQAAISLTILYLPILWISVLPGVFFFLPAKNI